MVQSGDTLTGIAAELGTDLTDPNYVYAGQTLTY